ncbi:titin-like isoform X2 [Malaya genurostris]|uniref:titin-like isoform X2 n=1 Tax=Malaya genurostris TaxID=325434 RepID=UPI0026F3F8BA|nr:titin-like isoform X2 [Malaya genurostris]
MEFLPTFSIFVWLRVPIRLSDIDNLLQDSIFESSNGARLVEYIKKKRTGGRMRLHNIFEQVAATARRPQFNFDNDTSDPHPLPNTPEDVIPCTQNEDAMEGPSSSPEAGPVSEGAANGGNEVPTAAIVTEEGAGCGSKSVPKSPAVSLARQVMINQYHRTNAAKCELLKQLASSTPKPDGNDALSRISTFTTSISPILERDSPPIVNPHELLQTVVPPEPVETVEIPISIEEEPDVADVHQILAPCSQAVPGHSTPAKVIVVRTLADAVQLTALEKQNRPPSPDVIVPETPSPPKDITESPKVIPHPPIQPRKLSTTFHILENGLSRPAEDIMTSDESEPIDASYQEGDSTPPNVSNNVSGLRSILKDADVSLRRRTSFRVSFSKQLVEQREISPAPSIPEAYYSHSDEESNESDFDEADFEVVDEVFSDESVEGEEDSESCQQQQDDMEEIRANLEKSFADVPERPGSPLINVVDEEPATWFGAVTPSCVHKDDKTNLQLVDIITDWDDEEDDEAEQDSGNLPEEIPETQPSQQHSNQTNRDALDISSSNLEVSADRLVDLPSPMPAVNDTLSEEAMPSTPIGPLPPPSQFTDSAKRRFIQENEENVINRLQSEMPSLQPEHSEESGDVANKTFEKVSETLVEIAQSFRGQAPPPPPVVVVDPPTTEPTDRKTIVPQKRGRKPMPASDPATTSYFENLELTYAKPASNAVAASKRKLYVEPKPKNGSSPISSAPSNNDINEVTSEIRNLKVVVQKLNVQQYMPMSVDVSPEQLNAHGGEEDDSMNEATEQETVETNEPIANGNIEQVPEVEESLVSEQSQDHDMTEQSVSMDVSQEQSTIENDVSQEESRADIDVSQEESTADNDVSEEHSMTDNDVSQEESNEYETADSTAGNIQSEEEQQSMEDTELPNDTSEDATIINNAETEQEIVNTAQPVEPEVVDVEDSPAEEEPKTGPTKKARSKPKQVPVEISEQPDVQDKVAIESDRLVEQESENLVALEDQPVEQVLEVTTASEQDINGEAKDTAADVGETIKGPIKKVRSKAKQMETENGEQLSQPPMSGAPSENDVDRIAKNKKGKKVQQKIAVEEKPVEQRTEEPMNVEQETIGESQHNPAVDEPKKKARPKAKQVAAEVVESTHEKNSQSSDTHEDNANRVSKHKVKQTHKKVTQENKPVEQMSEEPMNIEQGTAVESQNIPREDDPPKKTRTKAKPVAAEIAESTGEKNSQCSEDNANRVSKHKGNQTHKKTTPEDKPVEQIPEEPMNTEQGATVERMDIPAEDEPPKKTRSKAKPAVTDVAESTDEKSTREDNRALPTKIKQTHTKITQEDKPVEQMPEEPLNMQPETPVEDEPVKKIRSKVKQVESEVAKPTSEKIVQSSDTRENNANRVSKNKIKQIPRKISREDKPVEKTPDEPVNTEQGASVERMDIAAGEEPTKKTRSKPKQTVTEVAEPTADEKNAQSTREDRTSKNKIKQTHRKLTPEDKPVKQMPEEQTHIGLGTNAVTNDNVVVEGSKATSTINDPPKKSRSKAKQTIVESSVNQKNDVNLLSQNLNDLRMQPVVILEAKSIEQLLEESQCSQLETDDEVEEAQTETKETRFKSKPMEIESGKQADPTDSEPAVKHKNVKKAQPKLPQEDKPVEQLPEHRTDIEQRTVEDEPKKKTRTKVKQITPETAEPSGPKDNMGSQRSDSIEDKNKKVPIVPNQDKAVEGKAKIRLKAKQTAAVECNDPAGNDVNLVSRNKVDKEKAKPLGDKLSEETGGEPTKKSQPKVQQTETVNGEQLDSQRDPTGSEPSSDNDVNRVRKLKKGKKAQQKVTLEEKSVEQTSEEPMDGELRTDEERKKTRSKAKQTAVQSNDPAENDVNRESENQITKQTQQQISQPLEQKMGNDLVTDSEPNQIATQEKELVRVPEKKKRLRGKLVSTESDVEPVGQDNRKGKRLPPKPVEPNLSDTFTIELGTDADIPCTPAEEAIHVPKRSRSRQPSVHETIVVQQNAQNETDDATEHDQSQVESLLNGMELSIILEKLESPIRSTKNKMSKVTKTVDEPKSDTEPIPKVDGKLIKQRGRPAKKLAQPTATESAVPAQPDEQASEGHFENGSLHVSSAQSKSAGPVSVIYSRRHSINSESETDRESHSSDIHKLAARLEEKRAQAKHPKGREPNSKTSGERFPVVDRNEAVEVVVNVIPQTHFQDVMIGASVRNHRDTPESGESDFAGFDIEPAVPPTKPQRGRPRKNSVPAPKDPVPPASEILASVELMQKKRKLRSSTHEKIDPEEKPPDESSSLPSLEPLGGGLPSSVTSILGENPPLLIPVTPRLRLEEYQNRSGKSLRNKRKFMTVHLDSFKPKHVPRYLRDYDEDLDTTWRPTKVKKLKETPAEVRTHVDQGGDSGNGSEDEEPVRRSGRNRRLATQVLMTNPLVKSAFDEPNYRPLSIEEIVKAEVLAREIRQKEKHRWRKIRKAPVKRTKTIDREAASTSIESRKRIQVDPPEGSNEQTAAKKTCPDPTVDVVEPSTSTTHSTAESSSQPSSAPEIIAQEKQKAECWLMKLMAGTHAPNDRLPVDPIAGGVMHFTLDHLNFQERNGIQYSFFAYSERENCGFLRFSVGAVKKLTKTANFQLKFLILRGALQFTVNGKEMHTKGGDFLMLPENSKYSIKNSDEISLVFMIKVPTV